jgi:peptide/nickel transport system substrate-binding protein
VNGPYVVSAWEQGQSLTLIRNDKYFGPKAHLDSVVFRFLPESTTQPAALQNNEVDLIYPQPQLDLVAQVKALPDVTSELNIGLSFEHLDFNFKNEHLADADVRRAIATGLNIGELVDRTVRQFTDEAKPLGSRIWLPGQPYYQDHFGQYGKADAAGATRLLEEAGYTKGADGIYAKDGKKLSLRISTTTGNRKFFGEWLPRATSTSPTSAGSATPSPSPPARTSTGPAAAATTASTRATRSTSCSARRSGRSTRPSRPSSATRSTSS